MQHFTVFRFSESEVAELITTSCLEISGEIRTRKLSPNTKYGAYLILKTTERSYGLDSIPFKNTAYIRCQDAKKQQLETLFYSNRKQTMKSRVVEGDDRVMSKSEDGWMELDLGEFFNGGTCDDEVKMSLTETKGHQLIGGVIIEGIEIRPKT
ncbi:hypothetical protein V6N13_009628 [Hibiscus sabdariffa]|uniref:Uncharacterized protein n=1 Tax=Hibiscus sabdariffa TaxID=183260 RepID=A0ABR2B437_9ROSI